MFWLIHILGFLFFWPLLIITIPLHILISFVNSLESLANKCKNKIEKAERQKEINELKDLIKNNKRTESKSNVQSFESCKQNEFDSFIDKFMSEEKIYKN